MRDSHSVPVYQLTEADFQRHPVWQFQTAAEGEQGVDESHAFPATGALQRGSFGSFMVAATYTLTHGPEMQGAVQADILGAKVLVTPTSMFVHGKTVDPLARDVTTRLARITKTPKNRPERWRLDVLFNGESKTRSGRIARSAFAQALGLVLRLILLRLSRRPE